METFVFASSYRHFRRFVESENLDPRTVTLVMDENAFRGKTITDCRLVFLPGWRDVKNYQKLIQEFLLAIR